MKLLQNHPWINSTNAVLTLLGIFIMYGTVSFLVGDRFTEIENSTRDKIEAQEVLLTTIADATAKNGADVVTDSIVKDCPIAQRIQFDTLLDGLDGGLSSTQLIELERLFGRCGAFFSERKLVMVSRLSREVEIYKEYIIQLGAILNQDTFKEYSVEDWEELADFEKNRSVLSAELVTLQDDIITQLLAGRAIDSTEITNILVAVNEVQYSLDVANRQVAEVRSRLTSS